MSSDILDVLNVSEKDRVEGRELKRQRERNRSNAAQLQNKRAKTASMSRELYNLIGPNLPPISLQKSKIKFKEKIRSAENIHWKWEPFKDDARDDKLILHHWIKESTKKKPLETGPDPTTIKPGDKPGDKPEDSSSKLPEENLLNSSYKFEKYNTSLNIPTFTKSFYDANLSSLDSNWDYEETKYLFDIAKAYDLRWAVIEDNYDYTPETKKGSAQPKGNEKPVVDSDSIKSKKEVDGKKDDTHIDEAEDNESKNKTDDVENSKPSQSNPSQNEYGRSLEDLKERLYKVSALVLEKHDGVKDTALIRNLKAFDKEKEYQRRRYLEHLLERTPAEVAEEESLVIEARKLELAAKRMLTERAQLLQLLDSPQASASVQRYMTSAGLTQLYNTLMSADKYKKRKSVTPVAPQLGSNALPHTQLLQARQLEDEQRKNHTKSRKKRHSNSPATKSASLPYENEGLEIQQLLRSRLTQEQMDVYGISIHDDKIQPGVSLRSQKLSTFKPTTQTKVVEGLNEMGLASRPVMPTARVCTKFDELLRMLASLVELKKQTDNLKTEISLIKIQRGSK